MHQLVECVRVCSGPTEHDHTSLTSLTSLVSLSPCPVSSLSGFCCNIHFHEVQSP